MKTEIMNITNQTPIEVLLKIDDEGYTTARNLYEFLELNPANYSRWINKNIEDNPYAVSDIDYIKLNSSYKTSLTGRGNYTDYKITSDFAKKLSMTSNSKRGEQARNYFIEVEKKLKEKIENENKRNNALIAIINSKNDIEQALAIRNYTEIIEQPLLETIEKGKETIERQQSMVDLAELRISVCGCYTITDINKTFKFKKGKLTGYAKSLGMIHKTLNEVNKKGEEIFKVYSKDGKYNQIGITEKGLQWVKENKNNINNFTKE